MTGSLLDELRRRKVLRVATAYAVAAFVVLQVADLVVVPLALPDWTMTLLIVLAALGLVPAVALAWAFELTPEGVRRTRAGSGQSDAGPDAGSDPAGALSWPVSHRILLAGAVLVLAVASGAFITLRRGGGETAPLDANAVMVLPFRVAADPSLAYLGEGMVDLLAAKLPGDGGPRALDSRTVMRLWAQRTAAGTAPLDRQGAVALAGSAGAGQLLLGEIVGAAGQITLAATLHDVASGSARAPVTVAGPLDSLPLLVDRLVAQLLTMRAGEEARRLSQLTSASLPALRAYLAGKEAYRGGRFADAAAHFRRAVEIDSTFALAGLGLIHAGQWAEGGPQIRLGWRIAFRGRDRLPPRDRRRVELVRAIPFPERLRGYETLVDEDPSDAEAWLALGELLLHNATAVGYRDAFQRALHAFERAVAIDSIFAPALYHAIEIRARQGDTAQTRLLARAYFQRNAPESGYHSYIGWRTALALRDEALLATLRADRFEAVPYYDLVYIVSLGQTDALDMTDVERALDALERRASTSGDRVDAALHRYIYLMNAGRPAAAERASAGMRQGATTIRADLVVLRSALYWGGDEAAARRAVAELEREVSTPPPSQPDAALRRIDALCALEERRLAAGDASRTSAIGAAVRAAAAAVEASGEYEQAPDGESSRRTVEWMGDQCIAQLSALEAAVRAGDARGPEVGARLQALDAMLRARSEGGMFASAGNIIAARLHSERGDYGAGLDAVRRRGYWDEPFALSAQLLDEARLAELAGDPDSAIRAYAHYLHLRWDPEPTERGEVERARRELERLEAAQGRRR